MHVQDNRTPQRSHGRAIRGQRTRSQYVKYRGKRYSMVPAISAMGVLDWHLQEGSVNGSDLCLFAEHCLVRPACSWAYRFRACKQHLAACVCDACVALQVPHLRPFPQPHSVLVLDNCATHHTAAFTEMIEATGALTVFLPPYSPELDSVSTHLPLMMGVLCWSSVHTVPAPCCSYRGLARRRSSCSARQRHGCGGTLQRWRVWTLSGQCTRR